MKLTLMVGVLSVAAFMVGCGKSPSSSGGGSDYLASAEPSGAVGVAEAKKGTDESITVVGRIGGSEKPFVEGLAAFTIVDPQIEPCAKEENCPTPWDYCCAQDKMKDNMATVKVVDAKGSSVAGNAKELLKVKELSTVVVQGKRQADAEGNLTILASKIFVKD
jgi:hypothetical protein